MFEDIFNAIQNKNNEIRLMGVWGKDGLELEKKSFKPIADVDMELTGAELADIIAKLQIMKLSPDKYFFTLGYREHLLVIHSLTPEFFLLAVCDPGVITGKLFFYFDLHKDRIVRAL